MDSVVHFEIPADDMKRAQKFYSSVFGWKVNAMPQFAYAILETAPTGKDRMLEKPGSINGGMMQRKAPITSPVITISVKDIAASLKKIGKAGGKVVVPKFPVGDMGLSAYVKDTEGNIIGLWQDLKHS